MPIPMNNIVSAVFSNRMDAERAINQLRQMGVPNTAISVVAQHDTAIHNAAGTPVADVASDKAANTTKGLAAGAVVGALFGLAAAFIPGAGPFIAAGAFAEALGAAGGGAVAGAVVGATAGALAGALADFGVPETEARYYAGEIERGGVFVGVSTAGLPIPEEAIRQTLAQFGGRTSAMAV
ncbi:MAG TPA: general stress protein [bacterium]|nr:general stress protein [bacterium]